MAAAFPRFGLVVAGVAFVVDRLSKVLLIAAMRGEGMNETPFFTDKQIDLLPVFNIRMAWNYGISFSLFNSTSWIVIAAVQIVITIALLWYMWRLESRWMQLAAGLIVGGAIGNIFDRVMYSGAVADFFDFHLGEWHFATFNVADSFISIGVALWLLDAVLTASHHAPAPQGPNKD
jgi:signal peptidase II